MALTQEEENFSKLCKIVLTVIPENLRTYFKWQWNCMYPHNKWQDSAADGQFLIGLVPQQRLARVSYLKPILHAGDSNNWDPTALFFVLTNSAIGLTNQNERNELEKLRDIRNTCFHSKSASMTSPDLLRKITDIQNAFRTFNLQSGLVDITTIQNCPIKTQFSMQLQVQLDQEKQLNDHYNKYLAGQLNAIEENVEDLRERQSTVEDEMNRLKKTEQDPTTLKKQYIQDYTHWTTPCIAIEDGCVSLSSKQHLREQVFVDLNLVQYSSKETRITEELSGFLKQQREASEYKSITIEDILPEDCKIAFVRGVAGIGKTSLVEQIALSWATDPDCFSRFEYLFLIKCRELDHSQIADVDTFFREMFGVRLQDIRDKGERILVILDGFDEVPELESVIQQNTILNKLIKNNCGPLPGHSTIITGRPHIESILKRNQEITGILRTVEVSGLSKENSKLYIKKFTNGNYEIENNILTYLENCPNTASLCRIPQYLNSVCCILTMEKGNVEIEKLTWLYTWVYLSFIRAHSGSYNVEPYQILGDQSFTKFIHILGQISYQLLLENKIVFYKGAFKEFDEIMENNCQIKGMLQVFIIKVDRPWGYYYQFRHLTLQEFLAAAYCYINNEDVKELMNAGMFQLVTFLSGFISSNESKDETNIIRLFTNCLTKARVDSSAKPSFFRKMMIFKTRRRKNEETVVSFFNKTIEWLEEHKREINSVDDMFPLRTALVIIYEMINAEEKVNKDLMICRVKYLSCYAIGAFQIFEFNRFSEYDLVLFFHYLKILINSERTITLEDATLWIEEPLFTMNRTNSLSLMKAVPLFNTVWFYDCKFDDCWEVVATSLKQDTESKSKLKELYFQSTYSDGSCLSDADQTQLVVCMPFVNKVTLIGVHLHDRFWSEMIGNIEVAQDDGGCKLTKLILGGCNIDDGHQKKLWELKDLSVDCCKGGARNIPTERLKRPTAGRK